MKPFTESDRYEYPLTPESLVIDCGVHQGTFSHILHEKYGCQILGFEPVGQFYRQAAERLAPFEKIAVRQAGVGATTRTERMSIKGDMTGIFADNPEFEDVPVIAISEILAGLGEVDLIKINIEGMEFELLEAILDAGLATQLRNIQVQFHPILPDCERRHAAIRQGLLRTHHLTYDAPWCWENYARD
jgi:FkbM family methyltransferase